MKSILQYWLKTTIRPAQGDTVTLKNSVWPVQSRTMWNAQTEMLLEKTIYVMPTVHTEPTAWRGADDSEQVDNTMAFSLLVAAAAEAAFVSRISTWPLHLHGIAHTPGETLLPILSPSPHRTAPLIRDQLTLWNSFEQPPHLQHPCHFTWGLYMGMRILHRQHLPLVRSFWSVRQLFLHIEKT